jgi:hypothetical protein
MAPGVGTRRNMIAGKLSNSEPGERERGEETNNSLRLSPVVRDLKIGSDRFSQRDG